MRTLLREVETRHSPRSLAGRVRAHGGLILLESSLRRTWQGRYSLVAVEPQLTFRSNGARAEFVGAEGCQVHYGNPWSLLEAWLARYESPAEETLPYPAGAVMGFWGYELRQFVEPRLRPHPVSEALLPDCWLGFYDSLVVFDHRRGAAWVVSSGWEPGGGRSDQRARTRLEFWTEALRSEPGEEPSDTAEPGRRGSLRPVGGLWTPERPSFSEGGRGEELDSEGYQERVRSAQRYIRQGDIYQVNLSRRWRVAGAVEGWKLYCELARRSPAPYAAFLEAGDFALVSASPELFLRLDGPQILTRPIKGTRPRGQDAAADAALGAELLASAKERAELTMITDLLRNDLGKVCEFGSVRVPQLLRLERYAQVQHLVSTITGRLRSEVSHLRALEACFPGGSVTGAPKLRAMQIIDELEPVGRGPYTGCLGYIGFNRRSQLSIIIRAAVCGPEATWFHGGAGIVADSEPESEHLEVLTKVNCLSEILDKRWGLVAHLASVVREGAG